MKKDINDYLHLYLGRSCLVVSTIGGYDFPSVDTKITLTPLVLMQHHEKRMSVKPILRRLSYMTEEEANELEWYYPIQPNDENTWFDNLNAQDILPLLKHGFDLFGLIDAGLAIEEAKNIK